MAERQLIATQLAAVYPHTEKKYSLEQAVILMVEMSRLPDDEQPLWFWNKKKEYDQIIEVRP